MENVSHNWNVTVEEALNIQQHLRSQIEKTTSFNPCELKNVVGIDASYKNNQSRAAAVVFSFPEMTLLEYATAIYPIDFPYIPGLLSFREGPVVMAALEKLKTRPDLLLFDGQGYAHPRRFGLACHIGLYLNLPSIGCAKTLLVGKYEEPGSSIGNYSPLIDPASAEVIGAVLRTKQNVKPLFVSIGHKIDLPTVIEIVLKCLRSYRLPEPIRQADILAATIISA